MKPSTGVLILLGGGSAWLLKATVFTGSPSAKLSPITTDFIALSAALKHYKDHTKRYPTTEQGFAALVARQNSDLQSEEWIQILERIPADPWGHEHRYRLLPDGKDYELRSAGKDGVLGTEDDISSLDD
jgi:general secretion pathway protein G